MECGDPQLVVRPFFSHAVWIGVLLSPFVMGETHRNASVQDKTGTRPRAKGWECVSKEDSSLCPQLFQHVVNNVYYFVAQES